MKVKGSQRTAGAGGEGQMSEIHEEIERYKLPDEINESQRCNVQYRQYIKYVRINLSGDMVTYSGHHFIMHKNIKSLY